jgi:hypothetical protein
MPRKHLTAVAALVVTAALAFMVSATSAGTVQSRGSSASSGTTQIATISVQYRINRFVRRGHRLYAVGATIARFAPTAARPDLPSAVSRKPFMARVRMIGGGSASGDRAQRICPVLELTLAPTHLNLLGLIVDLSQVHLVITADSEGGLLGRLLCSLAGHRPTGRAMTHRLTQIAHRSGLSTRGMRFTTPVYQTASGGMTLGTSQGSLSPLTICPILDLVLGPLDLNLLGLIVHLDQVHLTIVADSEGGILGQLLAGLLCPPPPAPGRST